MRDEDISGKALSIFSVYSFETSHCSGMRYSYQRASKDLTKQVIPAVQAIPPLIPKHTPTTVQEKLEKDHKDWHVSQENYVVGCSLCAAILQKLNPSEQEDSADVVSQKKT